MMKKITLIAAGISIAFSSFGQKQNIQSANNMLRDKDFDKALEYINLAANDASTKDDPKTYFVKGNIYMAMQTEPKYKDTNPYREATKAYLAAVKLKANYEKETIDQALLNGAFNYYNDGIVAFNNKKYDDAMEFMKNTVDVHDLEGGKRYANKSFDTVAAQSKMIAAYSAVYANKTDQALPLLLAAKNDPLAVNANIYVMLSELYRTQNKDAEFMATLDEGAMKYPDNDNIRVQQLNYYLKSGKQDVIIAKLEEAIAKNPANASYQMQLANTYNTMANPKDASGNDMAKPANSAELMDKAEGYYLSAIKMEPNNVGYAYNTGALYFNKATEINNQMNKVTGTSAVEVKKYDELKVKRDAYFEQAIPYLDKTYTTLDPKSSSWTDDDRFYYQSSLVALREIYARQNKLDKAKELKEKLDASRK
jgi:hypothetical protein